MTILHACTAWFFCKHDQKIWSKRNVSPSAGGRGGRGVSSCKGIQESIWNFL